MHALLVTIGSHGDVHPFIGLGMKLRERGHRVTLAVNEHFKSLADRAGLEYVQLDTEERFFEGIQNPDVWHPRRGFEVIMKWLGPLTRAVYDIVMNHAVPGETVVAGSTLAIGARIAQEKHNIPLASIHLSPMIFRSAIDPPKPPGPPIPLWLPPSVFRMLNYIVDVAKIDPVIAPGLNEFRAELGLPKVKRIASNWWHSPQLVLAMFPEWFAPMQADWPQQTKLVGFPLFDERGMTHLSAELEEFLGAGEKPIAFTPGSANLHGREFFEAAVRHCVKLGRRGLLLTRHGDQIPRNLPASVRHVAFAPFSQLLPRCAALVHHGGIGTTSQALAGRVPQMITALSHDQFDNAMRVERINAGKGVSGRKFESSAGAGELEKVLAMRVPEFEFEDGLLRASEELEALYARTR